MCVGVDTERSHDNNYLHIPMYFFDCDLDGVNKPNYFARCITPQINLYAGTYNANRMRRAFPEELKAGRRLYKTAADIEWRKSLDVERMTVYKCDFIEPKIYINVLDPLHRHVGVKHVGVDLGESPELSEIKELNKELERWNSNQKKTIQDQDSEIKSLKDLLHKVLTHEQTSMSPILAMEVNQVLGPMYRLMGENGFNRRRTFDLFREKLEKGHIRNGVIKVDTEITPQTHPQAVDQMDSKRNEIASLKNCILNLVRQKNTANGKIDKAYLILNQDNGNNFNTLMRKIDSAKDALKGK